MLQFLPFVSRLEAGFWHELGRRKLECFKLSEAQQELHGSFSNTSVPGLPQHFTLEYTSFDEAVSVPPGCFSSPGSLLNTNTIDAFKTCDKKELLKVCAAKIWEDITSGAALDDPSLLARFFLLTFSDLKKFNYYYWFAFPALLPEQPIRFDQIATVDVTWNQKQLASLPGSYDQFRQANPGVGYFLIRREEDCVSFHTLRQFDSVHCQGSKLVVGLCDPSTLGINPGWPLRNFLLLIAQQWGVPEVDVLCYRDYTREGKRITSHSLLIAGVKLPPQRAKDDVPRCVGWEKNDKGKPTHKFVNLSSSMDPTRLAESSVDLNLKLMRWRLLPSLQLEEIAATSCLLLGAGTLGCNVARGLMGWGVRRITLVDNGRVSFSNPVRQTLFTFQDCVGGGRHKAMAAAESLKLIFPGVKAEGVDLSIPMPGHSVGSDAQSVAQTRAAVELLDRLISEHDVVFLLMDTRESRWLPTLLACARSKICINAALGFDTYMVMRHGFRPSPESVASPPLPEQAESGHSTRIPGCELGCYFCSDVVAPTDSTRDRTLDQQCTVSRPGLSMIASALAVELLMSVLQHPHRGLAVSETLSEDDDSESESVLGLVPHQIRGFLSRFHNVLPACRRFDMCTACSDVVLENFRTSGFDFLLKAFNSPNYLEDLTGLSELYAQTADDQVWELSDDDDF